ncbi:hypothetical protein GCM10027569_17410 [Flindersiella endophytica]
MLVAAAALTVFTLTAAAVPASPGHVGAQVERTPGATAAGQLTPFVAAGLRARQTGRRVELAAFRTETSEVYVNPDGTKTMEQHSEPVRVHQGTRWVAPDPALREQPDGSIRPVATVTPIALSGGGSGRLLTIGRPGEQISVGWPGTLPAPTLRGSTAVYPEVLPGVDLRIDVGVTGFSHLLVVKNRRAASNPALRTLRYPVASDSLRLNVRPDGTTVASKAGRTVFTAPPPTMWDADGKPARLGIAMSGKAMTLTPDARMLTGPNTRFPVAIDPSIGGSLVNWLHVNVRMGAQNAWNYDRNDGGAKVGRAYGSTANLYRSMFLLNTTSGAQAIAGSTIVSTTFRITIDHTPSGTKKPVQLWLLTDLATSTYIDWDNSGGYWRQNLATASGAAYPPPTDSPIEFSNDTLKGIVQGVADARRPQISLGLRAPDEGTGSEAQLQWKKFRPNTAVLSVTYNTKPLVPKSMNFTRSRPCGTATAPTAIATTQPQFSAIANDPDAGDTVTTTLQILDQAGSVVHTADVGPTVSGAAFAWPEVPAGTLVQNTVYRYRSFTKDSLTSGPATPDCYFVIDTVKPSVPQVQSADYPDGEPTLPARTVGTVTFRPGSAADADVAEYAYGFQQDKVTMRVKAGADGSATIPVTVWPDPTSGVPAKRLYVKAVDRAGNVSSTRAAWDLQALDNPAPVPHVRGDTNGDGRADVTAVFDHGYGRTAVWNVESGGASAFYTGFIGWDSGEAGGFNLYRTRPVQGDLDGDGRTDLALFREGAGRQVSLYKLVSDGNRYDAPPALWTSGANGWPLSTARVIGGDVDGDGRSDIVVQNAGTGDNWSALVFRAADNFAAPTTWATAASGNPWSRSAPLLADVDGDGRADLLSMRNLTGCRTAVDLYKSTGTGFAAAQTIYDSGAGAYCWEKSRPAVTDANGDGKDDIVALYEHGVGDAGLYVFTATGTTGTALTASSWWRGTSLDLAKATLAAGDFDGDRKGDAAIVYAGGPNSGDRQVYTFRSSGTAFGDKVLGWGGPTGAVTGPTFDIEQRTYELVNRNSGKCLNLKGNSTANEALFVQYTCVTAALNARFHIDAVAGSDQYALKPVHTATGAGPLKCADLSDWSMIDGGQLVQWPCGNGSGDPTANQQFLLEYVDGASYDTVIQLKLAHSGKCLSIIGGTLNDSDPVQQETCGQGANQQWILRPAYNATQLGENGAARYRTEAATSTTQVLDITDCHTEDGSDVRMWAWVAGSPCQGWKLESLGDDVYKLVDPHSSKVLDIDGCSQLPLGTVQTWTSNESECQRWRIEPSPGGSYSVLQVGSGLSLDVAGCSSAQGANVITWFYHGGPCQRWFFKRL